MKLQHLISKGFFLLIAFFCWFDLYGQETTVPDNTYGEGGRKTTTIDKSVSRTSTREVYYDANGRIVHVTTRWVSGTYESLKNEYYSCDWGTFSITEETWNEGRLIFKKEVFYQDYKIIQGYERREEQGQTKNKRYNTETRQWEDIASNAQTSSAQPQRQACPPDRSELYIGFSLVMEDAGNQTFNFYGGQAAYTHFLNQKIGITADAGVTFANEWGISYRNISVMAGPVLFPIAKAGRYNPLSFSIHALAGITNNHRKNNSFSNSQTSLSIDVGPGLNFDLTNNLALALRAGFNPVFSKGITVKNFRLGAGIVFDRNNPKIKSPSFAL